MMGWAALTETTHINSLEIGNKWTRREIAEWLHTQDPHARLPTSLPLLIQAMVELWPKWSGDDSKSGKFHKLTDDEKASQKDFLAIMRAPNSPVTRFSEDSQCFIFAQGSKFGGIYKLTRRRAFTAANTWTAGPPTSLSWHTFKLLSEVMFTTPECCFPCWIWGNKGFCYHQAAVREFLGLQPLTDPMTRTLKHSKGRGRTSKPKKRRFTADAEQLQGKAASRQRRSTTR